MHENLVILAGGASSRMKKPSSSKHLNQEEINQANERSKGLIGLGGEGRPLLDYLLFNAKKAGYKTVYLIISEKGALFKECYGPDDTGNDFHGLTINYAVQYIEKGRIKPLGTADALYQAIEQYPELSTAYYTVCNSDNLYSVAALKALRETTAPNAFISYDRNALDFPKERIARFAVAKLDSQNFLLDIIEKPTEQDIENCKDQNGILRVSMNAFKFKGETLATPLKECPIHPERNEKELPTVFLNMLKTHPKTAIGIPFSEHVPDLTAKDDIHTVKQFLAKNYPTTLEW
ncbi:sugar phosphate nucleotidyltransferase [Aquimarina hainanensis]|uniref:Sugar phosphate nucleotidyltransferase n=1 Tax=Aquimarina hainanensis TaxID=1578017 RepID=A0ABW5NC34_9FLAO